MQESATSNLNGTTTVASGGTVSIEGGAGNPTLTLGGALSNAGLLELDDTNGSSTRSATLTIGSGGSLTNTGTIQSLSSGGGSTGSRTIDGSLTSSGTIDIDTNTTISLTTSGETFTNSGVIDIASGVTLTIQGGTFTNLSSASFTGAGTLVLSGVSFGLTGTTGDDTFTLLNNLATGDVIDLDAGTGDVLNLKAGTNTATLQNIEFINGTGSNDTLTLVNAVTGTTIDLLGGTDTLSLAAGGNTITAVGIETINGGSGVDTISVASGSLVTLSSGLTAADIVVSTGAQTFAGVTFGVGLTNQSILTIDLTTAINGAFSNASGAIVNIAGTRFTDAELTVANGFTNAGTIFLTDTTGNAVRVASLTVTNGTLTNTGEIQIDDPFGGGATRTLDLVLDNQGTLDINTSATLTNTGRTFTNSGTIDIASGQTLTVSGGTTLFDTGTTLAANTGTLSLTNSGILTLNLNTSFASTGPSLSMSGASGSVGGVGTLSVGSTGTFTDTTVGVSFTNTGTTTVADVTFDDTMTNSAGTLTFNLTTAINGAFSNASGANVSIVGTRFTDAVLTVANGFTNAGTIVLTDTTGNAVKVASLTVTNGTLTNTGEIQIDDPFGGGATRTLNLVLDNQGTLDVNTSATLSTSGAAHVSSGIFDIASGVTLTVTGTSLTNQSAGTLQGDGTLNVSGLTFTNAGAINPATSGTAGSLNITGGVTFNSTSAVNIDIGGTTAGSNYDQLAISGAAALDGVLNVSLISAFTPTAGNTFSVVTFGSSSGNFDSITGLAVSNSLVLDPVLNATNLTLTATTATVQGTSSGETLNGTAGADVISADAGDDTINSSAGDALMFGGAGTDTVDYAAASGAVTVDLNTPTRQVIGADQGTDLLNGIENIIGSGDGDTLSGDAGANVLLGGGGVDNLTGRGGSDTFEYTAIADSAQGSGDTIADFDATDDSEDILLNGFTAGGFVFLGDENSTFSGGGDNAEARFNDASKLLEIDTNGDTSVDMEFTLTGVDINDLDANDFTTT